MDLSYLDQVILGNSMKAYGTVLIAFFSTLIVVSVIKKILFGRLKKLAEMTETRLDDFIVEHLEKFVIPVIYITTAYHLVTSTLTINSGLAKFIYALFLAFIIIYTVKFMISIIKFALTQYWVIKQGKEEEEAETNVRGISTFISIIIWTIAFIFFIDNLGFKISGIMAGIGIGGVTLALASQAILGDLFSYFVIFFDRPFEIGDFIKVDDKLGVIERIGIKTTRVKSLSGEQLVFSNTDLTRSRVHNYKKMLQRRIMFQFGVVYQTTYEHLETIPSMVKEIVESTENTLFDRAHFFTYGNSSLDFEVVYFVYGHEYNTYMDVQQEINLKIFKKFRDQGIDFAYPTRTVFIEKG